MTSDAAVTVATKNGDGATTTASPPSSENNNKEQQEQQEPIEYNPRWMGYLCIIMFSGINFIAISNVPSTLRQSVWAFSMAFGVLTFVISSLILIQDRCQKRKLLQNFFHYTKSKNGKIEGFTLLFFVLWWIVGVGYITQPGGIAYTTGNIYYSAWLTVFACVYTLNEWSDSKDILSIEEITSVSFTLRYWWIHFIAAFVVFASSISLEVRLYNNIYAEDLMSEGEKQDAVFGIFMGLLSLIVSCYFILVHYDFIKCVEEGGWTELFFSLFLILVWIIALSILTANDGIAATTSGFDCIPRLRSEWDAVVGGSFDVVAINNCTIYKNGIPERCRFSRYVPGSNLYFACWACMLSSVAVALKWKAAKALKFAQSQAERQQQQQERDNHQGGEYGGGSGGVDDDDDYDDDDTR